MDLDKIISDLTDICQLVDGWTQGSCGCGKEQPWSKWDEETRQKAHDLLKIMYDEKEAATPAPVEPANAEDIYECNDCAGGPCKWITKYPLTIDGLVPVQCPIDEHGISSAKWKLKPPVPVETKKGCEGCEHEGYKEDECPVYCKRDKTILDRYKPAEKGR